MKSKSVEVSECGFQNFEEAEAFRDALLTEDPDSDVRMFYSANEYVVQVRKQVRK